MKKAIRRHQQKVAKVRRIHILLTVHGGWRWHWQPNVWQQMARLTMSEPGWWIHERVVTPARVETRRMEHLITRGRDPDTVLWPDFRKPHDYYW